MRSLRLASGLIVFAATIGCSSQKLSVNSKANGEAKKTEFTLREFQEEVLPNGLKILFIEDKALPRVSLNMMVKVGANQDPQELEGLSHLTGWLLEDGTTQRSATKLADDFAAMGTELQASVTHETSSVAASCLSPQKERLLDLFSEVILSPGYATREIERKRAQSLSALEKMVENPGGYADQLLNESIFQKHPYGRLVIGSASSLKKIGKSDIVKHYFKYYRPNNSLLAVVGSFDEKFRQAVRAKFAKWQAHEVESSSFPEEKGAVATKIRLVSKSGLKQAQIRFGQLGIRRTDPDFLKLRLANVILGGAFESRLNQRVRDDLGLTYSISSQFDARKDRGSFEISTFSRNEKAGEAIRETLVELNKFAQRGVTSKELESAKALLIGQFPVAIETSDRLAFNLMVLRYYGVSDDYLRNFVPEVQAISLSDVNEAIKKHFHPDQMSIVVFADQNTVAEQLKAIRSVEIELVK